MTTPNVTESIITNESNLLEITEKAVISALLLLSIITTFKGLSQDMPFWDWAYARHSNTWSWFVRPLFIPLYVYFAYRRNLLGMITTIVGIATSMYWFPIPLNPNPDVLHFLDQEQLYLTTGWTPVKIIWSSFVPITLIALAIAFWKHSVPTGFGVINVIAFLKITWSVIEDPQSGWILIPFALLGLVITDLLVIIVARKKGIELLPKRN